MIVRSFLLVFSLFAAIVAAPLQAAVDSKAIEARVNTYMQQHLSEASQYYGDTVRLDYTINPLDPRLAMADCPVELEAKPRNNDLIGRITIKISCSSGRNWSLYVPVDVNLYRPVVAAITPVARDTVLDSSHLEMREMDISRLNGSYFTDIEEVIGMQAKRPIQPDMVIVANYLEPPLLIKRGESVLMTAESGGLVVKISGIAMMDGRKGQQISVRNSQSKRVVEARVKAPGQVVIPM